jgi:ribosomal protein L11 methyltransferase
VRRIAAVHYLALRFDVDAASADAWSDALIACGALSVDVSDPRAGSAGETPIFAEPGTADATWWPLSRIDALFAGDADLEDALRRASALAHATVPAFDVRPIAERDWVHATQTQFAPIRIAGDLYIVPTWCEPPNPDAINIALDPGLAFGTGSHATTRQCLEWLRAHLRGGERVLDYGCGSGILAIAAAKLGAGFVCGTDIDPQALSASEANAERNGITAMFAPPDALPREAFDVIIANILANPLVTLAPALARRVLPGGRIALSGILEAQADGVVAAYSRWFNIAPWRATEGWTLVEGTRRQSPA